MPAPLHETFTVDRSGAIVRSVTPARGTPYQHRCRLETLKEVIWHAEERGDAGFCSPVLAERLNGPPLYIGLTETYTAIAFLVDRGVLEREHRRIWLAPGEGFEDAMMHYYYASHIAQQKAS